VGISGIPFIYMTVLHQFLALATDTTTHECGSINYSEGLTTEIREKLNPCTKIGASRVAYFFRNKRTVPLM
jgi:hypothetical protein